MKRSSSPAVADVQHAHDIAVDSKEDSVDVWLPAVQKLADLHGRLSAFGGHGTA